MKKSRSLARQVNGELRDSWGDQKRARVEAKLLFAYSRAPYLLPQAGLGALLLAAPFAVGWGNSPPSWLDGAWQVTGVLIGFALVVFIFLLESIAGRSFRSAVTFKAVIQRSAIEWPLGFGLTFIGYAVLALRFGSASESSSDVPGWAETMIAGVFLLQIVLIGISFSRGIELARPGAVANAMTRLFRTEVLFSVENTVREQRSAEIMDQICNKASEQTGRKGAISSSSYFSLGTPLFATKVGRVKDFDLELPSEVARSLTKGEFAFGARLGDTISSGSAVAWLLQEPWTKELEATTSHGIAIGRSRHGSQAEAAFSEALDFAAREGLSQKSADLDLTLEVIPGMFLEVHQAWLLLGNPDSHFSPRGFFPRSLEDEMGHRLWTLCDQFLETGRQDLVDAIPQLASNFLAIGRRDDAPLVAHQGLELCVWQCHKVELLDDEEAQKSFASNAISVLNAHQRVLRYVLEDGHGPLGEQERSRDLLLTLSRAVIRSLKSLSDVGFAESFPTWIEDFNKGRVYSSLQAEVENLEFQATADPEARILTSLEQQRFRLSLVNEVDLDLTQGFFELGAWIAKRASGDADPSERWSHYLLPLSRAIGLDELKISLTGQNDQRRFPYLDSWFIDEMTSQGRSGWSGDGSGHGFRWCAILLLAKSPSRDEIKALLDNLDDSTRNGFAGQVESVASESEKWSFLLHGRAASETLEDFRTAMAASTETSKRVEAERIARAELSPEIINRVFKANAEAFKNGQALTRDLTAAGRVQTKVASRATKENTLETESFMPKEFFIDSGVYFDDDQFGNALARERDRRLFLALLGSTGDPSALSIEGLAESISHMDGSANRVIYASDTRSNRKLIFRHPEYAPDRSDGKFGTLAGVDIFMIPTDQTTSEVIAVDRREIGVVQFSDSPDSMIDMTVDKLDFALAKKLLSRGKDPTELDPTEVQESVNTQVFVSASTSFEPDFINLSSNYVTANLIEVTSTPDD